MYLTLFTGVMLTSCTDEDYTGASKIKYSDVAVAITLKSTQTSYTINESLIDEDTPSTYTIEINASIAQAQPVDAIVSFVQSDGTADSSDYTVGEIKIPAGETSASTNVEVNKTGEVEGTETFNLSAKTDDGNFTLANSFNLPVTIENDYINHVLEFSTTWSGETSSEVAPGVVFTLDHCNIDIDVVLYSSTGEPVSSLGATDNCTEEGSISGLPDGDYYIVLDVFNNDYITTGISEVVPVTISYSQDYFSSGSFVYNGLTIASQTGEIGVAILTIKDGYNYTVTAL